MAQQEQGGFRAALFVVAPPRMDDAARLRQTCRPNGNTRRQAMNPDTNAIPDKEQARARIQRWQENIAVGIGAFIGITLSVYFFTYAMLVDKGLSGWLWFEFISAILFVLILFRLRQVSRLIVRLTLGRKSPFRELMRD